jgi:hypothetical protein
MAIILTRDLAKSGYKPDIMYKSLIELLYLWLHYWKPNKKNLLGFFLVFSLPFGD